MYCTFNVFFLPLKMMISFIAVNHSLVDSWAMSLGELLSLSLLSLFLLNYIKMNEMWCFLTEYECICPNQNESNVHIFPFPVFHTLMQPVTLYCPLRSCSSSQISWHFWFFITSSSPSPSTLLWRCKSSWAPSSSAGIWTFIMRRVTRKLRSTPLIWTRNLARYETKAREHNAFINRIMQVQLW